MNEPWIKPEDLTGFEAVNWWLMAVPAALLITGSIIAVLDLPKWAVWLNYTLLTVLGVLSTAFLLFYVPAHEKQEIENSYISWVHDEYPNISLTDEQALNVLNNPYGYLDENNKVNYILAPTSNTGEGVVLQKLTVDNPYSYIPVS